jgi:hypothetical protein
VYFRLRPPAAPWAHSALSKARYPKAYALHSLLRLGRVMSSNKKAAVISCLAHAAEVAKSLIIW